MRCKRIQQLSFYGRPTLFEFVSSSGKKHQRAYVGEADGALTIPVFLSDNGQLKFVLNRGMVRPAILARHQVLTSYIPVSRVSSINRHKVTIEGPAGGIEVGETPEQAMARERVEELGLEGGVDFVIGQPVFPDARSVIERQVFGVSAHQGPIDVAQLKAEGDGTGGEAGTVPFVTNLAGLQRFLQRGQAPLCHFLLPALRLRAALGTRINPLAWRDRPFGNLPNNIPQGVEFDLSERLDYQLGSDQTGLRVLGFNHALVMHDGEKRPLSYKTIVAYTPLGIDSLMMFLLLKNQGEPAVVVKRSEEQPIYHARAVEADRLSARTYNCDGIVESASFSSGLELPIDNQALHSGGGFRVGTLKSYAQRQLAGLIGKEAAKTARWKSLLKPTFANPGILAKLLYPAVFEIENPASINLAADLEVIPLATLFERIGAGTFNDMTTEVMALQWAFKNNFPIPDYLSAFDAQGFLQALR